MTFGTTLVLKAKTSPLRSDKWTIFPHRRVVSNIIPPFSYCFSFEFLHCIVADCLDVLKEHIFVSNVRTFNHYKLQKLKRRPASDQHTL